MTPKAFLRQLGKDPVMLHAFIKNPNRILKKMKFTKRQADQIKNAVAHQIHKRLRTDRPDIGIIAF